MLQESLHVGISTAALSCTARPATCAGLASCIASICCLYICILQLQGVCADRFGHCVLLLVLNQGLFPSWGNIHLQDMAPNRLQVVLACGYSSTCPNYSCSGGQAHQKGSLTVSQHSWGARHIHNARMCMSAVKLQLSSWSAALCKVC